MVAAILPLALLAAIKPGFKVAPVTAFIVLVPLSGAASPPLTYALERILEISIGSVVGLATALLVLPARAHHNLAQLAAKAADLNAELMVSLFEGLTSDAGRPALRAQHAAIRKTLAQAEAVVDEAVRERKSWLTDSADPEPLFRSLNRLRHDLVMVARATAKPLPAVLAPRLLPKFAGVRDAGSSLLRGMAEALRTRQAAPSLERFESALRDHAAEMDAVWKDKVTQALAAHHDVDLRHLGQHLAPVIGREHPAIDDPAGRQACADGAEERDRAGMAGGRAGMSDQHRIRRERRRLRHDRVDRHRAELGIQQPDRMPVVD
jgi:uncharacterized membrane protein YccC